MSFMSSSTHRFALIAIAVTLIAAGLVVFASARKAPDAAQNIPDALSEVTLTGETTCLPKKGDGPHTMECAIGLKADDGKHYAMDLSAISTIEGFWDTGKHITIEGTLVPVVMLSTDHWQTYDIEGVIRVRSAVDV